MDIRHEATTGTNESGDARITVAPNPAGGLSLELQGPSVARYGVDIRAAAMATLGALGIEHATVSISEKGALDATIRARLAAACGRAAGSDATPWEALT